MTACSQSELITYAVDPARLAHGAWCHTRDKTIGEGDIAASYSADRIGMDQPIRKPFEWQGSIWVCVGSGPYNGVPSFKAYRLVHPGLFAGTPTTYREKTRDCDAARADPNGFYHGMTVRHTGEAMVLCGPPALFIAGEKQQLSLFE